MGRRVLFSMFVVAGFLGGCSFSASFMQNGLGGSNTKTDTVHWHRLAQGPLAFTPASSSPLELVLIDVLDALPNARD